MNLIRTAQTIALILIGLLVFGFFAAFMTTGFSGGIYPTKIAPFWIFSPAILGLILLPYLKTSSIQLKEQVLLNRAKAFLAGISSQGLTLVVAYFMARDGQDFLVSMAVYAFISPVIFYFGFFMSIVLQKRAQRNVMKEA